jgi:tRNA-modifying protein YgfZ
MYSARIRYSMADLHYTALDDLAVLDVRGPDVISFLQGQVSNDMDLLAERGSLFAALSNAQGRVVALLRLLHVAQDQALIVLPAELAETVRLLLSKYVLRAKVTIAAASTAWRVYGVTGPDAGAAAITRIHMTLDAGGWRQMIVAPRTEALPETEPATRESWQLADIEAGLPQVFTSTSGTFVAQMLNLDLLDAISLTKGCYTGQEVIARAHYRGQVKRRMQRFFTEASDALEPGARVQLDDRRNAQIVMAAPAEGGGQQFLAVTNLTAGVADEELAPPAAAAQPARLPAIQLSLPRG